ncbi:MAG: phosphate ABC transporter ATP-binding protein [Acidobacteria bacterium]|nr:MAG: phosphate ABC transporter ATP-binding protein [Acidobacteriota bacterium]
MHHAPRTSGNRVVKRVSVDAVSAYFGAHKAVEDVSMVIEPARVTALIGPSGCGKSTLIRTINRLHEVVPGARIEGTVHLDEIDIYGESIDPVLVRRQIGMVFQRPNPFPTMSIYDNVASGLRLNRVKNKDTLDSAVERSLKLAGLWDEVSSRLNNPGGGLSGGQQQRLCIARAIAVEPAVLLMDEPCSALDPISTLKIEDLIHELKERYTIVIVTHNMQQAARVSDVTAFFTIAGAGEPGRLIEMDETSKIFTNPGDERTEAYVTGRFG